MTSITKYPPISTWNKLLQRPTKSVEAIESVVDVVFAAVKSEGDTAISRYTKQFDKVYRLIIKNRYKRSLSFTCVNIF